MRLIDADGLLAIFDHDLDCFETEGKSEGQLWISVADMRRMIEGQPTVFDADRIVEQLKAASVTMAEKKAPHTYYKAIGTRKAEEIVRKGGMADGKGDHADSAMQILRADGAD